MSRAILCDGAARSTRGVSGHFIMMQRIVAQSEVFRGHVLCPRRWFKVSGGSGRSHVVVNQLVVNSLTEADLPAFDRSARH